MAKEKMRERIVEAARRLFLENGYNNVLVDDIVRDLGISKKTIYNHFAGKSDMLKACIDQFVAEYDRDAEAIINDVDLSLRQKLAEYLRFVGVSFANISQEFLAELKRLEPEAWEKLCAYRRDIILKHFGPLMDEGVRVGYLRNDSTRYLGLMVYISAMQQLSDPDYVRQFPDEMAGLIPTEMAELADQMILLLLRGLLTPKFYTEQTVQSEETEMCYDV
ncbi:TetR/AcrR family transcriptional regulator [Spirosoma terrae]|uniref:TetR/AcrR family transcriptional regulator n=1 Tax=Spirosoma terrae TaxID=1968276 RepID=A0A6L9L5Q7_9BACT|nr:TetR/AcrR family transcriptional regulator [Spirosoma terrae]NDU95945.1 TetR/AcrR family transcriptional regulator [Spirosoma terrae]